MFFLITFTSFQHVFLSLFGIIVLFFLGNYFFKSLSKDSKNILPLNFSKKIRKPFFLLLLSLFLKITSNLLDEIAETILDILSAAGTVGIIASITWGIIVLLKVFKEKALQSYDISEADNLKARKVYTQFIILENTIIFIVVILAISIALMSFESIRSIGVSVLTSAGVAGIIIGFAAQKAIGTVLAGIQIALTQPLKIDDVVIVEEEWGRIEEIALTYVVVAVWDKRRLIVPTTYFIENTFQNWTRRTADIMGTVFLYTDYTLPLDKLREELTRLLEGNQYWDGKVNALQVTNATEKTMELRALMSAGSSPDAWELRVYIREKLIEFIKNNYPECLPQLRVQFDKD